ncbi:hypothetical protein GCM10011506_05650 [Marivirga lumbricoides]|uniref:LVIVD repeat-containing protein n=1 Tax=Marivirga lumbricoides TaxID=1046115 RepID=A0ABQ1LD69_9BACT|nr:hypothetical protein GCM10011506_05650 [Marivirga lumbricoides]
MKQTMPSLKFKPALLLLLLLPLISCEFWEPVPDFDVEEIEGMRPIYATESEVEVKNLNAQQIESPGKIYVINEYLLVVDQLRGVHVFNNTDPENPRNIGFIQIAGSNDVAIRNNILYADQGKDLLAIDISNPENVKLMSRVKGVFPFAAQYPMVEGTYFECPDPSKGIVVGWEAAILKKPECYR